MVEEERKPDPDIELEGVSRPSPHQGWTGSYGAAYSSTLGYTGRGNGKVCPQKSFSTLVRMLKRQRQHKRSSLERQADENMYVCVYICMHMYNRRLSVNQKDTSINTCLNMDEP